MAFNQKEKREHYNAVAKGQKPVKDPSKFKPEIQVSYAKGQADARNESAAIYKYNQSTPQQRDEHKANQAAKRAATLTSKCKSCGKPCDSKYATCYACFKSGKNAPTATQPTKPKKGGK